MRILVPVIVASAVVMATFLACSSGGIEYRNYDAGPIPPPSPTASARPTDCDALGGKCMVNACDVDREYCRGMTACRSAPATAQCGDANKRDSVPAAFRCCIPLVLDEHGWRKLLFDEACGLSVPTDGSEPPPEIVWEPCDATLSDTWPGCRRIRVDWPAGEGVFAGRSMGEAQAAFFDKQTNGTVLLVNPISKDSSYRLVVYADGDTRQAVRETTPNCSVTQADLTLSLSLLTVVRREGDTIVRAGTLYGTAYRPYPGNAAEGTPMNYLGARAYLTTPANVLTDYNAPDAGLLPEQRALPFEGQLTNVVYRGDALFFANGDPAHPGIKMFKGGELNDFLTFGDDVTRGSADFGTDNRDMVWTEASGRSAPGESWARIDIVTSAYTVIPEFIGEPTHKRRLRSETSFGNAPFVVGCEYAAHAMVDGVRLVRLSDGRSWTFTTAGDWRATSPLAISCDEVFLRLRRGDDHQVARLPLDMLGEGVASD